MFNEYPYRNIEDLNLDYLQARVRNLEKIVGQFVALESVTFADPIQWSIASQYAKNTVVLDADGDAFISIKPVPAGVYLNNGEYWLEIFNFMDYVKSFNSNLTFNIEANTDRASVPYSVDDWLLWDDVLYKVTAAIAADDLLEVGVNIVHFTVEDFIKAWINYANGLIVQYKNDIDASELAYRNQLAGDIANTTASLQAQLDAAIAGVTVDSEVINARIGADGITYSTLGEALRTQFTKLFEALKYYFIVDTPAVTHGVYYDNSGVVGEITSGQNAWWHFAYDVTAGTPYIVSFVTHGTSRYSIIYADASDNVLDKQYIESSAIETVYNDHIILPPTGCVKLYVTSYATGYDLPVIRIPSDDFYDVFEKLVNDETLDITLRASWADDLRVTREPLIYYNDGGVIASTTGGTGWASTHISVEEGQIYKASFKGYGTARYCVIFADISGNVLSESYMPGTNTLTEYINQYITVPAGAKTLYVNTRISGTPYLLELALIRYDLNAVLETLSFNNQPLTVNDIAAMDAVLDYNRNEKFFNFGFITDTHVNTKPNAEIYLNSLARVNNSNLLNMSIHNGDFITTEHDDNTPYSLDEVKEATLEQINKLSSINGFYFVEGNHDNGHDVDANEDLSLVQMNILYNALDRDVVHDSARPTAMYYYKDFPNEKIRVIVLRTFDDAGDEHIGTLQLNWFNNYAADVPAGYTTIIIGHYIDPNDSDYTDICNAIATFASTHLLAGVLNGHTHTDGYYNSDGYNLINVRCGFECYDLFTIDTTNQVLYESRVGAGSSRSYHYGTNAADNYEIT